MIFQPAPPQFVRRRTRVHLAKMVRQPLRRYIAPRQPAQRIAIGRTVIDIKPRRQVRRIRAFVEHDHIRLGPPHAPDHLPPEIAGNQIAAVSAEPIRVKFPNEIQQVIRKVIAHGRVFQIKTRERPFALIDGFEKIRALRPQRIARSAVDIHHIQQHAHSQHVRRANKILQILLRAVFRVNPVIILHTIRIFRVVKAAFDHPPAPETRIHIVIRLIHGREIDQIHSEPSEMRQHFLRAFERSFRCKRAQK